MTGAKTHRRRRRGPATAARAVIFVIELYRNIVSPLRFPSCRFTPTCSEYALEALHECGLVRGGALSLVRLAKCGPWHPGGWDPVPEPETSSGVSVERGESEHVVF